MSILGVYAGYVDKFPLGPLMNRGITIKTGQCHVHRYMKPLLARIERGEIDPSFVVSHHMKLDEAAAGYDMFMHKRDEVMKSSSDPEFGPPTPGNSLISGEPAQPLRQDLRRVPFRSPRPL